MLVHVADFTALFAISVYMLGGGGLNEWLDMDTDADTGANLTTVPEGGVPIPILVPQLQPHSSSSSSSLLLPPADVSTAAASLVMTLPMIISQTTELSGQTPTSLGGMEHYVPPHAQTFTTPY
jgi:hypothetical protein